MSVSTELERLRPQYGSAAAGEIHDPAVQRVAALLLLRGLGGIDFVGGDLVEVAPQDDATTTTAQAGAQRLSKIVSLRVLAVAARRAAASRRA